MRQHQASSSILSTISPGGARVWRRRRYLSLGAIILLCLIWFLIAEPIILVALHPEFDFEAGMDVRGMLALVLALGFTIRGSWRANGFSGGLQLRWWPVLWPIWIVAIPTLAIYAGECSWWKHVLTFGFCITNAFTEEAIFRGVILRNLLPGGTRSAILWSSALFGASHLMWFLSGYDARVVLLITAYAFAVGLVFAWVRLAAASIWPGVIAHCFNDYGAFIKSGGLDASMRYSMNDAVLVGLFTILLFTWAWRLMFHEAWRNDRAAGAFADPTAEHA